jgi:hypothetical protein
MNALFLSVLIGIVGVAIYEGVGWLARRDAGSNAEKVDRHAAPSRIARIGYRSFVVAFVISPLLAVWSASSLVPARVWDASLLITSAFWLLLGLIPLAVSAAQGRAAFDALKASVEVQSRTPFPVFGPPLDSCNCDCCSHFHPWAKQLRSRVRIT